MTTKLSITLRVLALSLALMLGITGTVGMPTFGAATAYAQETDPLDVDEDEGFDDWGLLGLLGLAGLLGLRRQPDRHVVVDDATRRSH